MSEIVRLVDVMDWECKPRKVWIEDDDGNREEVTQVRRADGLWQTVPYEYQQIWAVYGFATLEKA